MGNMATRKVYEAIELIDVEAEIASDTGDEVRLQSMPNAMQFTLDVTSAATGADTLDVTVETLVNGTDWLDIVHFTQILGNGGALRYIEKVVSHASQAGFEVGTALTAGSTRNILGDAFRVSYVIAGAAGPSFDFSVTGCPC